jgi:multicomponent Na+:H+ antiporter subunit B
VRLGVFAIGAAGLAVLFVWAFAGLPAVGDFTGAYGNLLAQATPVERHSSEVVSVATFDYRGVDTLVEELILFTATVGVMALLRLHREEDAPPGDSDEGAPTAHSLTTRSLATGLVGPAIVFGGYIVAHGHITPGGGFQGGVLLAGALLLLYVAGVRIGRRPYHSLELAHGIGAAGFALIGLGGLIALGTYLENFLGPGRFATLFSAGDVPLLNTTVGLEVTGAVLIVLGEILDQRLMGGGSE